MTVPCLEYVVCSKLIICCTNIENRKRAREERTEDQRLLAMKRNKLEKLETTNDEHNLQLEMIKTISLSKAEVFSTELSTTPLWSQRSNCFESKVE
jgi:hypothetical protein